MDLAKRFLWFISELNTSLNLDQHMVSELQDCLHKVKDKINDLNIDIIGQIKTSPASSINE